MGRSVLRLLVRHEERLGLDVKGVDKSPEAANDAMHATGVFCTTGLDDAMLGAPDVVSLCVPCGEDFEPLYIVLAVAMHRWRAALFSIESTVPRPGGVPALVEDRDVIMFPHRLSPHDEGHDEADSDVRVMGGVTSRALHRGIRFWGPIVGLDRIIACTWEEAVLCKVMENAARFVEIALVEEIAMAAERHGVEPHRLLDLMRTKWNMGHLPEPLDGIGRHCLPKDVEFAAKLTGDKHNCLFSAAMDTDDAYQTDLDAVIKHFKKFGSSKG